MFEERKLCIRKAMVITMPETLQAPLRDAGDIKIFILYLMSHIDRPLTYGEIYDITVQNGVVKPFDFSLVFPDLPETGHIYRTEADGTEAFTVSPAGREVADSLSGNVLHTTKEKALRNAIQLLNRKKTGRGYHYDIASTPEGKFVFHFAFTEAGADTMTMSVTANTRKEAENMETTFELQPELIYRSILALLNNNASPVATYDPFALL